MPWDYRAITNEGNEMLNEMMAGKVLKVTRAFGGTGVVDLETETLEEQTGLVELRQELAVLDVENTEEGKIICIQISNVGVEEEYKLNQIAVFASLDGAEERMLFIMQDKTGASIPSVTETPDFLLEIYALLRITNTVKLEVTVDCAGVATRKFVQEYVSKALQEAEENSPGSTKTGSGPPTTNTDGVAGQHYFDTDSGLEYVCKGTSEDGTTIWEPAGSGNAEDITYNGKPLDEALDNFIQRPATAKVGQIIVVKAVDKDGKPTEWEAVNRTVYIAQDTAPNDTTILWIDTANESIIKYYNGTAWVPTHSVWAE